MNTIFKYKSIIIIFLLIIQIIISLYYSSNTTLDNKVLKDQNEILLQEVDSLGILYEHLIAKDGVYIEIIDRLNKTSKEEHDKMLKDIGGIDTLNVNEIQRLFDTYDSIDSK